MTDEHELPSDSDEDDEDYVPDGADSEPVSEVESDGDAESGPEVENDENKSKGLGKKSKKRTKGAKSRGRKRRKALNDQETKEKEVETVSEEKKQLTEEEEKKRADSLWADFVKDTGSSMHKPKSETQGSTNGSKEKSPPLIKAKAEEKVKITKIFEFAGEEVKVEKEVPVDSIEARIGLSSAENSTKPGDSASPAAKGSGRGRGARGGHRLGGISSVLGKLEKKAKISTLEKSKLDWDNYKKEENIQEELTTYNKGKDGYLERQDFLQRADLRQFEIEKQLRTTGRRSTR